MEINHTFKKLAPVTVATRAIHRALENGIAGASSSPDSETSYVGSVTTPTVFSRSVFSALGLLGLSIEEAGAAMVPGEDKGLSGDRFTVGQRESIQEEPARKKLSIWIGKLSGISSRNIAAPSRGDT